MGSACAILCLQIGRDLEESEIARRPVARVAWEVIKDLLSLDSVNSEV